MFKIKKLISLILLNFFYMSVQAQISAVRNSANNEKLMNYPISLTTGLPQIEIPLYSIDFAGMSIPITLSYHASGLKLSQNSGMVGAGWSLSAQHQISRTVRGREDEFYPMPPQIYNMNLEELNQNGQSNSNQFSSKWERDVFLTKFMLPDPSRGGGTSSIYPMDFQSNEYFDSELDIFRYNLFGKSGKFVFGNRDPYVIQLLDYDMLYKDFKFIQRPYNDSFFTIKDDKGISYKFGDNLRKQFLIQGPAQVNTSWFLTSAHALNGDSILFDYWGTNFEQNKLGKSIYIQEGCHSCFPYLGMVPTYVNQSSDEPSAGQEVVPRSITFAEGSLEYSYNSLNVGGINESVVDELNVYDLDFKSIKKVKFFYQQGLRYILLDSIKISGGNEKPMVYRFDYQLKDQFNVAFDSIAMHADLWGYLAKRQIVVPGSKRTDLPFSTTFTTFDIYDYSGNVYKKLPTFVPGVEFDHKYSPLDIPSPYSLSKITYPTGGSTEYIYERNRTSLGVGPGYRIKEILTNDDYSNKQFRKTYSYQDINNTEGQGYLLNYMVQALSDSHDNGVAVGVKPNDSGQPSSYILYNTYTIRNQSAMDLEGLDDNPVYYVKVTEQIYNGTTPLSKTVHHYESLEWDVIKFKSGGPTRNQLPNIEGRGMIGRSMNPNVLEYIFMGYRPNLLAKTDYIFFQNQWKKTSNAVFTYEAKPDPQSLANDSWGYRNVRVKNFAKMTPDYSGSFGVYDVYIHGNIDSFFDFNPYYIIPAPKRVLLSKAITTYSK